MFYWNFFFVKALVNQIENLRIECEKLQAANTELQRQRDLLEDEKDDIVKDKFDNWKKMNDCKIK